MLMQNCRDVFQEEEKFTENITCVAWLCCRRHCRVQLTGTENKASYILCSQEVWCAAKVAY